MTPMLDPDSVAAEAAVVVLEPLDWNAWLREHGWYAPGATCRPERINGYQIVAYSTARPRRGGGFHQRRVWFVKATDLAAYGEHDWPVEAVDPASIAPRRMSQPMGLPPWRLVDAGSVPRSGR
jgi:hypothetical protein